MRMIGFAIALLSLSPHAQASCKPFSVSSAMFGFSISYSATCGPDIILKMTVSHASASVSVDSDSLSSPGVDVKKAIILRLSNGLSQSDATKIVSVIGPALEKGDFAKAKLALIDLILATPETP